MKEKQVLFLTRKFPPSRGGMETFSFELTNHYTENFHVIHYGNKQRDIVWAAPLLLLRALFRRKKTTVYHLGDLVLAPIAPLLKKITKKPIVATAHALELTHPNKLLRTLIDWSLPSIDHIVAVSDYTATLLKEHKVPITKISVITHGIQKKERRSHDSDKKIIQKTLKLPSSDDPIILTVGRLVKRKGALWFIQNVLPALEKFHPTYILTSEGPEQERIADYIHTKKIKNVILTGKISDTFLEILYSGSDIFVMPNRKISGDAEGFGFVAIEAAAAALPVAASHIEGVPSAIHDQKNGILHEPGNIHEYIKTMTHWLENPEERKAFGKKARDYTEKHFSWNIVAQQYKRLFDTLSS